MLLSFKISTLIILLSVASVIGAESAKSAGMHPVSFGTPKTDQSKDPWFGKDKLEHLVVSAMMTGLGFFVVREHLGASETTSLVVGTGISLGAGVGKEYYDSRKPNGKASIKDLVANVVGAGLAIFLIKTA